MQQISPPESPGVLKAGNPGKSLAYWQGRTAEIAQIQQWLIDKNTFLIGIEGIGGTGKSMLATKIYDEIVVGYGIGYVVGLGGNINSLSSYENRNSRLFFNYMLQKPLVSLLTMGLFVQSIAAHSQALTYNYSNPSLSQQSLLISQFRPGASCEANDNLSLFADTFISVCRKASIRREFPSEFLNSYLEDIKKNKSAIGKKAWKLLNDNRFKK
ncbi:hypothetical protein [Nostoc sp. DSM 114159]